MSALERALNATTREQGEGATAAYTVSIGTRGASVYVNNYASHPLGFNFNWPEMDEDLRKKGVAIAQLIRAAPDLLEALKLAAAELGINNPNDLAFESDLAGTIRAAIAKATGEQP